MAKFQIKGPYELPRDGKCIDVNAVWDKDNHFWEKNQCAEKIGCYIYAQRLAQGYILPWYIGKTWVSFYKQSFSGGKFAAFQGKLASHFGRPLIFFLILKTKKNKKAIRELEVDLIGLGALSNPDLINKQNNKDSRYEIEGENKRGNPGKARKAFKRMLGKGK